MGISAETIEKMELNYVIAAHHIKTYKDLMSILDNPKSDPRHRRAADQCLSEIAKQAIGEAIEEAEGK